MANKVIMSAIFFTAW